MNDHDDNNPWGDGPAKPPASPDPAEPIDDDPLAGLAAAAAAQPPPVWQVHGPRTDTHGRLIDELDCRGCGYNLLSLPLNGNCPECGQPVEWSARGDRLGYCDPHWLASLRTGMLWFIIACIAVIVLGVVNYVVSTAIISAGTQSHYSPPRPGQPGQTGFNQYSYAPQSQNMAIAVDVVIGLVASGLFLFAVWKLTASEPGKPDEPVLSARSLFRWGWVCSTVLGTAANITALASQDVSMVMSGIAALAWIVSFFALFIYLRRLALRVPDTGLAGQTRLVMWGLLSCYSVIILAALGIALVGFSSPTPSSFAGVSIVGGCSMCLSGLGIIVFAIWGFVLTFLYCAAFTRAHRFAVHARSRVREVPSFG